RRLGKATVPVLAGFAALTVLALGVPVGSAVYWIFEGGAHAIAGVTLPGVVAAFALAYFTEHYLGGLAYQSAPLLVACYAIMFFPLALVGVKASLAPAPASLDDIARSLGRHRLAVLVRV